MSSIDTLRWLAGSTDTGRATCSTLAITVSTWLAPVRRTVSGSAAREQTWIMGDLFATIIAGAVGWAKRHVRRSSKSEGGSVPTTFVTTKRRGALRKGAFAALRNLREHRAEPLQKLLL